MGSRRVSVVTSSPRALPTEPRREGCPGGVDSNTVDRDLQAKNRRRSQPPDVSATARITLTPIEAAEALGVSRDFFDDHVKNELRLVRRGRLVLVPLRELERWVDENASRALE